MATSSWPTINYPSSDLTESAGAILFDEDNRRICILKYMKQSHDSSTSSTIEYLLPKGRRNWLESRADAAVREVYEETGYACELLVLYMKTRCPPEDEVDGNTPDKVRRVCDRGEPFMLQVRQLGEGRVKLIWWYAAAFYGAREKGKGESQFEAVWYGYDEVVEMLTFESDREVVRKAVEIVEGEGKCKV